MFRTWKPAASSFLISDSADCWGETAGGLAELVAIENRADGLEVVVAEEIDGFPDLPLTGFAVAHDAEDALVEVVELGGNAESRGDREPLAQRPGGGIEKGHAQRGVGVAVDRRVQLAEGHRQFAGHRAEVAGVVAVVDAQVRHGGVNDGYGVSFGEDQAVGGGVAGVGRLVAEVGVE